MIVEEVRAVDTKVIVGVVCDMCRKPCEGKEGILSSFDYASFYAIWGYGSKRDGEVWNCHLCEECSEMVATFIRNCGGDVRITHCR